METRRRALAVVAMALVALSTSVHGLGSADGSSSSILDITPPPAQPIGTHVVPPSNHTAVDDVALPSPNTTEAHAEKAGMGDEPPAPVVVDVASDGPTTLPGNAERQKPVVPGEVDSTHTSPTESTAVPTPIPSTSKNALEHSKNTEPAILSSSWSEESAEITGDGTASSETTAPSATSSTTNVPLQTATSAPTTTPAPTTPKETTLAPTTDAPTTLAPTTEAPTTEAPTTPAPTTTQMVTTNAPTTASKATSRPALRTAAPVDGGDGLEEGDTTKPAGVLEGDENTVVVNNDARPSSNKNRATKPTMMYATIGFFGFGVLCVFLILRRRRSPTSSSPRHHRPAAPTAGTYAKLANPHDPYDDVDDMDWDEETWDDDAATSTPRRRLSPDAHNPFSRGRPDPSPPMTPRSAPVMETTMSAPVIPVLPPPAPTLAQPINPFAVNHDVFSEFGMVPQVTTATKTPPTSSSPPKSQSSPPKPTTTPATNLFAMEMDDHADASGWDDDEWAT
ncbi:hypothetical protein SPRG_03951 [Saprolegnia parasitica CBS 223.65]|uniref:Uncharacterized protein n=1 Tax=Saprolegnia parasitica (strain CBS 223.65) TaxID=695850 RepID=A0A067CKU2_SAPPC|nr:hypothetical protein SPRG_03951 [Saprolegnia parasitica CBS 223.65]KDO31334.1 hypothetical protein SPRG_03951 [Saprolegnia parasitica CBS 223.65]|eukprot:XP_012197933.1 hypothetical protein SPRG_03951 [Saprolegnia parasitica CBS 223.65]